MSAHRFAVGQVVHLRSSFRLLPAAAGSYRITGLMPARDNSPQYRIRSDEEHHDRVATEDDLEEVGSRAGEEIHEH
jgi:hypothetical protein